MPDIYFPHLGIQIDSLSRVAFSINGFNVYWYGVIIISAILIGYFAIDHTLKKLGSSIDEYLNFILIVLVTSIIGARLYYVAFNLDYYTSNPIEILNLRNGGLAIYGGVIAAILTAIIYCKISKKNFLILADLFAPYLVLGQAMGRWGNFFNKEAFGTYTDNIFAMALKKSEVNNINQSVLDNVVTYFNTEYIQVHPTFLYESFICFVIFIFLLYRYNHNHKRGEIFFEYISLYSFARFFIEGLRSDQLLIYNVPISQIVAIIFFIIGIISIVYIYKNDKNEKKIK